MESNRLSRFPKEAIGSIGGWANSPSKALAGGAFIRSPPNTVAGGISRCPARRHVDGFWMPGFRGKRAPLFRDHLRSIFLGGYSRSRAPAATLIARTPQPAPVLRGPPCPGLAFRARHVKWSEKRRRAGACHFFEPALRPRLGKA